MVSWCGQRSRLCLTRQDRRSELQHFTFTLKHSFARERVCLIHCEFPREKHPSYCSSFNSYFRIGITAHCWNAFFFFLGKFSTFVKHGWKESQYLGSTDPDFMLSISWVSYSLWFSMSKQPLQPFIKDIQCFWFCLKCFTSSILLIVMRVLDIINYYSLLMRI